MVSLVQSGACARDMCARHSPLEGIDELGPLGYRDVSSWQAFGDEGHPGGNLARESGREDSDDRHDKGHGIGWEGRDQAAQQ